MVDTATIIHNTEIARDLFRLELCAPGLARAARPGQFVMVKVGDGLSAPLLRRPFSLCGVSADSVMILFQVRGAGTGLMAGWSAGKSVDLVGPLGKGFEMPENTETALLVAGGVGIAPLLFLMQELSRLQAGPGVQLFFGCRASSGLRLLDAFDRTGIQVHVATEDGSAGHRGLVTSLLEGALENTALTRIPNAVIFACGPLPMAQSVARLAGSRDVPCQLSLEAAMACGTGACLGCVVPVLGRAATGAGTYRRVCADGPVFDSSIIDWSRVHI